MNENDIRYPAQCPPNITMKNKAQSQREWNLQPSEQPWAVGCSDTEPITYVTAVWKVHLCRMFSLSNAELNYINISCFAS